MLNLGFNYRITDFQCALGISQLKKLEKFVIKKKPNSKNYRKNLSNIKNLTLPHIEPNISHAYHLFPIKVDFKNIKISKETILRKFRKYNINLQVHYFPVHLQPFYKKNLILTEIHSLVQKIFTSLLYLFQFIIISRKKRLIK